MQNSKNSLLQEQIIPIGLTLVVLAVLSVVLLTTIRLLNLLPTASKIVPVLRWGDVLIGATIYLKTSVDFAIFMGRLMSSNPGWKKRIAIEIGTAAGNALGTILILIIWIFFKEVQWLLAIMILLAALVLFELAYAGLEHFSNWQNAPRSLDEGGEGQRIKRIIYFTLDNFLSTILKFTQPITSKILPDLGEKLKGKFNLPWKALLMFCFTVPFILGLDDFAGYVPLFNVVNIFGFGVGVMAAHTVLNIALFISPERTVKAVRNEWVSFLGTLAFIGLGIWGLVEVARIFVG